MNRKKILEEIERFSGMPTLEYDEIIEALHDLLIIAEKQLMETCEGCGGEIIPAELENETVHFIPENGWCAMELPECMSSVCDVAVCETVSPDGGVCEDCVDKTMNSGVCLECSNEECDIRFMCDNCGIHPIIGYMGGDSSAFLCCAGCWAEVEALDPEERDYQAEAQEFCSSCREVVA